MSFEEEFPSLKDLVLFSKKNPPSISEKCVELPVSLFRQHLLDRTRVKEAIESWKKIARTYSEGRRNSILGILEGLEKELGL